MTSLHTCNRASASHGQRRPSQRKPLSSTGHTRSSESRRRRENPGARRLGVHGYAVRVVMADVVRQGPKGRTRPYARRRAMRLSSRGQARRPFPRVSGSRGDVVKKKRMRQQPLFPVERCTAPLMLHLPPSMLAKLRKSAHLANTSVGALVREMLRSHLERFKTL
jgi:hypothetical protein